MVRAVISPIRILSTTSLPGGSRCISRSLSNTVQHLPPPDTLARNEIDSAADTSCAGPNWIPLYFTGELVQVHGYDGKQRDTAVPLATCATKIIAASGTPYILVCPQMLWFGTQHQRTLLNPNQLRMHGTLVLDDPTADGDDCFGLTTDNLYIPFQTAGSAIYFDSHTPTYEEVEEYCHQKIGPDKWNPSTVQLRDKASPNRGAMEIAIVRSQNRVPFTELSMNNRPVEISEQPNEPATVLSSISTVYDGKTFDKLLLSKALTHYS